jgi:hypothetical protein
MIGLEVLVTAQAPTPAELTPAPTELTESELAVPTEPVEPTATSLSKLPQQLDSLIHMLSDWKKSVEGWSTCVREEWEGGGLPSYSSRRGVWGMNGDDVIDGG